MLKTERSFTSVKAVLACRQKFFEYKETGFLTLRNIFIIGQAQRIKHKIYLVLIDDIKAAGVHTHRAREGERAGFQGSKFNRGFAGGW